MASIVSGSQPMIELVWFNRSGEAQKSLVPLSLVAPVGSSAGAPEAAPPVVHKAEEIRPPTKLGTNVYVSRLPKTITQEQLEKLFQPYGSIISCRVVFHTQGKQGRVPRDPVGFVQFLYPEVAQSAIAQVNGMLFEGKRLVVRLADQDKDKGITSLPSDNLYIANLPKHFTEADLLRIFSPYGQVEDLVVLKHLATGQSKGSGMVRFSSVEESTQAKDALNCAQLPGLEYPLEVKFAESKTDKLLRQRQKVSAAKPTDSKSQGSVPMVEVRPAELVSPSVPPSTGLFMPPSPATRGSRQPSTVSISVLEEYLKNMMPQHDKAPPRGRPGALWETPSVDLPDASTGSDNWELNTYGYSSDSNSDNPIALSTDGTPPTVDPFQTVEPPSPFLPGAFPFMLPGLLRSPTASSPQSHDPTDWPASGSFVGLDMVGGNTTVRITNLPPGTTQLTLYQLCAHFGAILSCSLQQEGDTVAASLMFKKAEEAAQVELKLDGHVHIGHKLHVQLC